MLLNVDIFIKDRLELIKFDGQTLKTYDYEPEREQKETQFPNASIYRVDYEVRNKDIRADHEYFAAYTEVIKDASNENPIVVETKRLPSVIVEGSLIRISGVVGNTAANGDWLAKNISLDNKTFDLYKLDGVGLSEGNGDYVSGGVIEVALPDEQETFGVATFTRKPFPTPLNVYYDITVSSTKKEHADRMNELMHQVFPPGFQTRIPDCLGVATFVLLQHYMRDERFKPVYRSAYQYVVDGLWVERLERYPQAPIITVDWLPEAENIYY